MYNQYIIIIKFYIYNNIKKHMNILLKKKPIGNTSLTNSIDL